MPFTPERTAPMPSPPLSSEDALDLEHLKRMTLGDPALQREVLGMFVAQASRLLEALTAHPQDRAALAHTLRGSAQAIGAFAVADAAGRLEQAGLEGGDLAQAITDLTDKVARACAAIAAMDGPIVTGAGRTDPL